MKDNSVSQKAPYVKLIKDGTEISMSPHLFLTDASKEILRKGADGQGFIYFVNVTTGEIHLLAANNPEKQVTIHLPDQDRSQDNDAKSALQDEYKKNLYKLEVDYKKW